MPKFLVSLGIISRCCWSITQGLQQWVTRRELGVFAFRAGRGRLVHSSFPQSFFHSKACCVTKSRAGLSRSRGRSGHENENNKMEKSWDVSEHLCSEKKVSPFSLASQGENRTVKPQYTKSCHSLSCRKHLTLIPLGNFLRHRIL